jgi:hypothetical protein
MAEMPRDGAVGTCGDVSWADIDDMTKGTAAAALGEESCPETVEMLSGWGATDLGSVWL